jgi:hypothetical protein
MSRLILLSLLILAGASCVRVAPYQRGQLADPSMAISHENAESRFRAHVHDSREGATGGYGSSGGGCGCN